MAAPLFSVVVPAYNATDTLAAALDSALAQTIDDYEVVVVDDGSTDDTLELARSYEQAGVRVVSQANAGLPAARNAGLRAAEAPYASFLDSDDLLMPLYLERMAAATAANPDAALFFTDAWAFDDETRKVLRTSAMDQFRPPAIAGDPEGFLQQLLDDNFIYVSTTVRRDAVERVGFFNERLRAAEDYELWLRLLAHGELAVEVPGRLAVRRERFDSMSKDPSRMYTALAEVYRIVADEMPASPRARTHALERIAAIERESSIETGSALGERSARLVRRVRGGTRRRLSRSDQWLETAPPELTEAFGDLTRL